MGGQACVFYGAAEFSRDCDVVLFADERNFANLASALDELQAVCIALPEFKPEYLQRGHAVHFRCFHPDVTGIRLDVMTKLRGCDDFEQLWSRRTTIEDAHAKISYELLSIEDLVLAKKTQRDKDWPMIRRLVESHYDQFQNEATKEMVRFWLRESRTPALIRTVARSHPDLTSEIANRRIWLMNVDLDNDEVIEQALKEEENVERSCDENYWHPLKQELIELRLKRSSQPRPKE
jgi:hypothetical protein